MFAWFSPAVSRFLRRLHLFSSDTNQLISKSFYVVFITAFFLLCLLMIRDVFWIHGYKIAEKLKKASDVFDPMKPAAIKKANIITVFLTFLLSGYALYEGMKFPDIKETIIYSEKIESPFKIVALTDTHFTPLSSVKRIDKIVNTVNALKPDIIVLVGDIVDAKPNRLKKQMQALKKLKAKYGTFVTLGNHEFYHGSFQWEKKFKEMGFFYLANDGLMLWKPNVYISGLPDPQLLKINDIAMEGIKNTLKRAPSTALRVFLSHSPRFIQKLDNTLIDLQISGHTHGGQIFPFHFVVKKFIK